MLMGNGVGVLGVSVCVGGAVQEIIATMQGVLLCMKYLKGYYKLKKEKLVLIF